MPALPSINYLQNNDAAKNDLRYEAHQYYSTSNNMFSPKAPSMPPGYETSLAMSQMDTMSFFDQA